MLSTYRYFMLMDNLPIWAKVAIAVCLSISAIIYFVRRFGGSEPAAAIGRGIGVIDSKERK